MIPNSVSASSLELAEKCLASYAASSFNRGAGFGNEPAKLGTCLHEALETYTNPSFMSNGMWDLEFLLTCFQAAYFKHFGMDTNSEWYQQGMQILTGWHNRPYQKAEMHETNILSREVKESFPVPFVYQGVKGSVPCNYIIDRLDQTGENEYRVVDYKSQRTPWGSEEMYGKIQPRIYSLAIQIKYPDAKSICVQYDYLRYEPQAVFFSKADNVITWKWLKQAVQRIVDTDVNNAPETLNDGCRYCIRKLSCNAVKSNLQVGGIFAYDIYTLSDRFAEMVHQLDAQKSALDNIEHELLTHAQQNGELEWYTDKSKVKVHIKKTRRVNYEKLSKIVPMEVLAEYPRVNLGDLDKIRLDPRLTAEQRSLLETAVDTTYGEPSIKVTKRGIHDSV